MAADQQQQQQGQSQYNQIYTLGVQPGIKRDGTTFESREFSDGVWCRFQRGIPKKIGGYNTLSNTFNGIPRGMIMNAYNGVNYVFAGNQNGLDVFTTGQSFGIGSGPYSAIMATGYAPFTIATNTTTSFTISSSTDYTSTFPAGTKVVFSKLITSGAFVVGTSYTIASVGTTNFTLIGASSNTVGVSFIATGVGTGTGTATTNQTANSTIYTVSSSSFAVGITTVNFGSAISGTLSTVYLANTYFQTDSRLLWQFDYQYSPLGGTLNLISHPGLNLNNIDNGVASQVYIGSTIPNANNQWVMTGLADTSGTSPTYKPIVVDGGVCVLHPFIFVYGSNGFIANNNVSSVYANQSLTDWNGPLANQVNVASGKIVKGMPVRGGTSSPSGLFWATDSLIRVSFVNNPPTYWQYDIVSSQISIMSSSAVVEMDGLYFWMGVDRFYVYNGQVNVLPNDKNVNWLFDNINYAQRQKVWATKVPKYNEIWFFYPRGSATECTDAIIYNTKDKIWYDAGQAEGAQRSSGFTTEVFPSPIWGDWNYNVSYSVAYTIGSTPTGQSAATAFQFYLSGDQSGIFSPGQYLTFSNQSTSAPKYLITTSQFINNTTIGIPGATLVTVATTFGASPSVGTSVYIIKGGYAIWQHESGLNKITLNAESSIYSSFTTCDISWVGGTPSEDTSIGINRRMHLRRLEPDFVQSGSMNLIILGRKFARGPIEDSGPFVFDENTEKIDLRIEHREIRLKFESDTIDGNYEMGRNLITAEFGDERP